MNEPRVEMFFKAYQQVISKINIKKIVHEQYKKISLKYNNHKNIK